MSLQREMLRWPAFCGHSPPISRRSFFGKHDALLASSNIPNERGRHVACHKAFQDFRFLTVYPEIRTSWAMQDAQLGEFGPRLEVCPRNQRLKALEHSDSATGRLLII